MQIQIKTVVDITETNRNRNDGSVEYKQQSNLNTLIQTVGIKVNSYYDSPPQLESLELTDEFGSNIKGEHNVWTFTLNVEYEGGIDHNDLLELFDLVPVTTDLNETVKINKNVFHTKDKKYKNISFEIV